MYYRNYCKISGKLEYKFKVLQIKVFNMYSNFINFVRGESIVTKNYLEETLLIITAVVLSVYLGGLLLSSSSKYNGILWVAPILLIVIAIGIFILKKSK